MAEKIAFQRRFSLLASHQFSRDLEQNLRPQSFSIPWMQGYKAFHLQDGRCSTRKENTLKRTMCSKQDFISIFLLVIMALILKWSGIYSKRIFQTVPYVSDIKWLYVRYLKTVSCSSPSDPPTKSSWQSPFSQPANCTGSWHLTTTLV